MPRLALAPVAVVVAVAVAAGILPARADLITGTFTATVSEHTTDTLDLFGQGASYDPYGAIVTGTFSYNTANLGPLSVIPETGFAGDYQWLQANAGALTLTVTTGATTTTVVSSSSGEVYVANRDYQLFSALGSDGSNAIEDYIVSNSYFLPTDSPAAPNYAFSMPNGAITQTGESYLHVGGETITFTDTTVNVTDQAVPEPSSLVLLAGLAGLRLVRRRR